jgi:hypothetical protein
MVVFLALVVIVGVNFGPAVAMLEAEDFPAFLWALASATPV